ncbi:MAG: long-chain-acyl-CoA synthetase [Pseudomonadota bacterium]|nr:long-chain-acyl-CoA synthetase [Pseudomonadota bacterium]
MLSRLLDIFGDLRVIGEKLFVPMPKTTDIGSLSLLAEKNAEAYPNRVALVSDGETETWTGLNQRANCVAQTLRSEGVQKGHTVALLMENRSEFVVQVLALNKLGAISALINTNLTKQSLVHCINVVGSKKIIFGEELLDSVDEIKTNLSLESPNDFFFVPDKKAINCPNWAFLSESEKQKEGSAEPVDSSGVTIGSTAFYIFTSGTTGLPKAANVSHRRFLLAAGMSAKYLLRIKEEDRMYNCLPLYHGTGLMIGLGAAVTVGASSVLKRKLSVSQFWGDIKKTNSTCFVYIGEFIRYLMAAEPSSMDKDNGIKSVVGNGLRPDIWMDFKKRFKIDRIGEFYGASEGNGGFANVFNKDCTVGLPTAPSKIIAYDVEEDQIVRGPDGFCEEMPVGSAGLLVIEVTEKSQFEGYTNAEATEKKILRDVFQKGDKYFNTGDLMKTVNVGFGYFQPHFQFVDRIGDTFRWKGENVSTNEVGEIITQTRGIEFANVYGVKIPGTEGKAGMAAVVLDKGLVEPDIALSRLFANVNENLPVYARPVFIRILRDLPTTSTHKMQKNKLKSEAFNVSEISETVFVKKPNQNGYSRLDYDFYSMIMEGKAGF